MPGHTLSNCLMVSVSGAEKPVVAVGGEMVQKYNAKVTKISKREEDHEHRLS